MAYDNYADFHNEFRNTLLMECAAPSGVTDSYVIPKLVPTLYMMWKASKEESGIARDFAHDTITRPEYWTTPIYRSATENGTTGPT